MSAVIKKEKSITLEDRLLDKFDDLQIAREDGQQGLFDEIVKSIEVLFKGLPPAYNDLMEAKQLLNKELSEEYKKLQQEAMNAKDDIDRQVLLNQKSIKLQWEYRDTYEEIIMEVLQGYILIRFESNLTSEAYNKYEEPEVVEEQPQQPQQQEEQPVPMEPIPEETTEKKPKLLKQKKDNFEV